MKMWPAKCSKIHMYVVTVRMKKIIRYVFLLKENKDDNYMGFIRLISSLKNVWKKNRNPLLRKSILAYS